MIWTRVHDSVDFVRSSHKYQKPKVIRQPDGSRTTLATSKGAP